MGPVGQADGISPAFFVLVWFFFLVKLPEQFNLGLERVSRPTPSPPMSFLPAAISARAAQVKSLCHCSVIFDFALPLPSANLTSSLLLFFFFTFPSRLSM